MLANASCQAKNASNDTPLSRASSLPHWDSHQIEGVSPIAIIGLLRAYRLNRSANA